MPVTRTIVVTAILLAGAATSGLAAGQSSTAIRELQLGYVALDEGDFENAMRHYARARELAVGDEQLFQAHLGVGSVALELERFDEARAALETAHRLRPGEAGATFLLGVACRRQGDAATAVKYLAEASARDPDFTPALVELGVAYGALERHADAERVCREVVEREPDNIEARLGLAVALYHQDELPEAIDQFHRALELDPSNVRAHYGLGLSLVFVGDRKGAMAELRFLNQHAPDLGAELYGWIFPDG